MRRRERCVQAESQSKGILLLGFSQYGAQLCSMKPVYQFGFGLRRAHTPLSETSTSDGDGDDDGDGDEEEDRVVTFNPSQKLKTAACEEGQGLCTVLLTMVR